MPILTHCFKVFPSHLENEFGKIYEPQHHFIDQDTQVLEKVRQKMLEPQAKLYGAHFGGRWLAAAVVIGTQQTRFICHLQVHHGARLRGVGKKLLSEIKHQESLAGNERLITCISSQNRSAKFFLEAFSAQSEPNQRAAATEPEMLLEHQNQPRPALCYNLL